MTNSWRETLAAGKVLVIDGGMGTELERRGVPMDEVVWSGAAVLSHPAVVRSVHEDYIRAGADVIITNTFGSTRQMLAGAGLGAQVEQVHRRAVALAQEARAATTDSVAIAGSLSPSPPGFDRQAYPPPEEELAVYRESAQLLTEGGVDLIALEMLEDTTHAPLAMRAALETGLPVWLGVSCRRVDGRLVRFSESSAEVLLADILDVLVPMGPDVVTIMHSEVDAVSEALAMVRARWTGPVGVYPESGYFTETELELRGRDFAGRPGARGTRLDRRWGSHRRRLLRHRSGPHQGVAPGAGRLATRAPAVRFHPSPALDAADVDEVLAAVKAYVHRLLAARGADDEDDGGTTVDEWANEAPVLAGLAAATDATTSGRN